MIFLTAVAVVSRANAPSSRSSVSFAEIGTSALVTQRRVNSFVEEEELTDVDDDDIPRRPQRVEKRPAEPLLQQQPWRVRSRLRFVSESNNFRIRYL